MRKLAILMPAYNAGIYIKDSIDSILDQSYTDFDLYVYDDCSNDNTETILATYNDSRIHYRRNETNLGIAKTLNKGLDELIPLYEYIARMDADDWCYPERIKIQLQFLDQNTDIILCGTQGYWLKEIGQNPDKGWHYPTTNNAIRYNLLFSASFGHSSIIYKTSVLTAYNLRYNENIKTCEDWELWTRIIKIGEIANLADFLMKYRIVSDSNHRAPEKIKTHLEERCLIIADYWAYLGIQFSAAEVYEFYYDKQPMQVTAFCFKLEKVISSFNKIAETAVSELSEKEMKQFIYLLSRRILDFRKRAGQNKFNLRIWLLLLSKVKFSAKLPLIRSIIR